LCQYPNVNRGKQILGLLLLLGVLLAIASSAIWTTQPEPEYNGKKLSQWAELYEKSRGPENTIFRTQAIDAAHQTRDQLVPYALKLIRQEPPSWWTALVRKLAMSPTSRHLITRSAPGGVTVVVTGGGFARRWIPHTIWDLLNYDPGRLSTTYFAMLGPDASSAVPELGSLLQQTKSGTVASRAISALVCIGQAGQASLAEILADPKSPYRRGTAYIIEDLKKQGVDVYAMVPSLAKNLADSDHNVAKATAYSLGEMAIEPDIAVPALTNCLQSTDPYLRGAALDALAKFRASACSAVPALVAELDDPDPSVRGWATNALRHVAPEYFHPDINLVTTPLDLSAP
jgi:hypothetical protein